MLVVMLMVFAVVIFVVLWFGINWVTRFLAALYLLSLPVW